MFVGHSVVILITEENTHKHVFAQIYRRTDIGYVLIVEGVGGQKNIIAKMIDKKKQKSET